MCECVCVSVCVCVCVRACVHVCMYVSNVICFTDVSSSVSGTSLPLAPSPPPSSGLEDWSFAQKELLQKAGYDIRKEFEEKEREFEKKEKQFETRSSSCYLFTSPLSQWLSHCFLLFYLRITELEEQRAEAEEMFIKQMKVA